MIKKTLLTIVAGLSLVMLSGCDAVEQKVARNLGGTTTITLKAGERLVTANWKDKDRSIWLLTKMDPSTPPQTYIFKEDSTFGLLEGEVIIKEQ